MAHLKSGRGVLCRSEDLREGGPGMRFEMPMGDGMAPAFVIRFRGRAHAFLNRCAHLAVELDWNHGEFFDRTGEHLVCATHGALYDPATGLCVAGPCRGKGLVPVLVYECDGKVMLAQESETQVATK